MNRNQGDQVQSPRVVVFAHRPYETEYHGASIYLRSFVRSLRRAVPVEVSAPPERPTAVRASGESSGPLLVGLRDLLSAGLRWVRVIARQCVTSPADRYRILIAFDIYPAGVAALWARVSGGRLVYCPVDASSEVARDWTTAGYRGGWLFRFVRRPLDVLGIRTADLVVVPSDVVRASVRAEGVPESRIRVLPVRRSPPKLDPSAVAGWRAALKLDSRIPVVFVGSFQYAPNVHALEFLHSTVAPATLASDPDLVFLVAGLDSEGYRSFEAPNLRVLGTIPDLDGLLYASRIGIAPMDVGGGTSVKIIDYALHGLEIVATPEAAASMGSIEGLTVAPRPRFAECLHAVCSGIRTGAIARRDPRRSAGLWDRYVDDGRPDSLAREIEDLLRS